LHSYNGLFGRGFFCRRHDKSLSYLAIEGMRNVQRLLKTQNPRISEVNVDDLVDNRYIHKLDESGFFERIHGK
jgi:hypothetical protein